MGFVPPVHLMHSRRRSGGYYKCPDSDEVTSLIFETLQAYPDVSIDFGETTPEEFFDWGDYDKKKATVYYKGKEMFSVKPHHGDWAKYYYAYYPGTDRWADMLSHNSYYRALDEIRQSFDWRDPENKEIRDLLDKVGSAKLDEMDDLIEEGERLKKQAALAAEFTPSESNDISKDDYTDSV